MFQLTYSDDRAAALDRDQATLHLQTCFTINTGFPMTVRYFDSLALLHS